MKLNKSQWEPKVVDHKIIEQELAKTHPYTDGRVDRLVRTENGVVVDTVYLTKSEWDGCLESRAIARLLIDYR